MRHARAHLAIAAIAAAALCLTVLAAQTKPTPPSPAARRQFVTCPIVRDTKTQPCWLAEYDGEVYYLGQQSGVASDFYPPQLGHQVLVEGTVGTTGRVCGGIPLQSVKVSVFKELTPACNTMLPAEDGIEAPPPIPAPRGPAPSWVKLASPGDVTLYFDFDDDFFSFHVTVALTNLAAHITATKPARVEIVGFRAVTRLSNGQVLTERAPIGAVRARKVADTLEGLGVARSILVASAPDTPERADGINDPWNRRVEIHIR
jgi:hypothetical protein